jgi:hypothetical protein
MHAPFLKIFDLFEIAKWLCYRDLNLPIANLSAHISRRIVKGFFNLRLQKLQINLAIASK